MLRQYRLNGEIHLVPGTLPPLPKPFVGREGLMQSLVHQLLAGQRLVFLTGPDGIGKTGLALRAAHHLVESGYFADGVIWLDGRACRSFGGLLDEFSVQLGLRITPGTTREQRTKHIIHQLISHDYMVVVDELEALNDGRTAALQLLRQIRDPVIVTARIHPPGPEHPLRVTPLMAQEIITLFETLGLTPPYPADSSEYLRFEGSPLIVRILSALLKTGVSLERIWKALNEIQTGPLIDRTAIHEGKTKTPARAAYVSLQTLSADQQHAALVASLLRPQFDVPLLAATMQAPPGGAASDVAVLYERSLVQAYTEDESLWRMHSSVLEAFEGLLLAPEAYHQRAAAILSKRTIDAQLAAVEHMRRAGQSRAAARWLMWQAPAFIAAGRVGALAEEMAAFAPAQLGAVIWRSLNEARGDLALRSLDWDDAARCYEHAIVQLRDSSPTEEARQVGARLARKLGEVFLQRGNLPSARAWLERAEQALPEEALSEQINLLLARSALALTTGEFSEAAAAAQAALGRADHLPEPSRSVVLCTAYHQLGDIARESRDLVAAGTHYEAALVLAQAQDDVRLQAALSARLADVQSQRGYWVSAVENLEQSIALWAEAGIERQLAEAYFKLGSLWLGQGRSIQALNALREAERLARWLDLGSLALLAAIRQAETLLLQGDMAGGLNLLREQQDAAIQGGWPDVLAELYRVQAEQARRGGDRVRAKQWASESARWAQRAGDYPAQVRAQAIQAMLNGSSREIETAVANLDETNQWLLATRLRLEHASSLAATRPDEAARWLQKARETLPLLGVQDEIEMATQIMRRLQQEHEET